MNMKWIVGGVLTALVLFLGMGYFGAAGTANKMESALMAVKENNENILSTYSQKVQEVAQVSTMAKDDLKEVLKDMFSAKFGANGTQGLRTLIETKLPTVDPRLYLKLTDVILAGRNDFQRNQTRLVDTKRAYVTALGSPLQGKFMSMAGYPQLNVGYPRGSQDDFKIITSDYARDAFENGKERGPIQMRPKQP